MSTEILSRCGYRCDLCLAYRGNVENEDRRQQLSDGWFKYFGFRIPPEHILCDGCHKDDCQVHRQLDQNCPVRTCVKEKELDNCSHCNSFMCEIFKKRLVDFEELEEKYGSKIPEADRELFIKPYENRRLISQEKNGFIKAVFSIHKDYLF